VSEFIPPDDEIREWFAKGQGIPRSVLSILIAYTKNDLFERILGSRIPDLPFFRRLITEW
jgi:NAD-specific glutamate dehydrogenase